MTLKQFGVVLIATSLLIINSDAWARKWKPSSIESAQDYLMIDHGISVKEKVLLFWFAPEYFPDTPETAPLRSMLQDYMMVGLIHFTISDLGEVDMKNSNEITVELSNSVTLSPLSKNDIPPAVIAVPYTLKSIMARSMGKIGNGLEIFVYDGKQIDRCSSGILKVKYLAEQYEFQTPIPGCK